MSPMRVMEDNEIEAFVKFNYFHKEQNRSFKNNIYHPQNLYYNSKEDYYMCPMGQHMENIGTSMRKSESGFISNTTLYEEMNCSGCPLRCRCHQAIGNRRIGINHNLNRHKDIVRQMLTSEEGIYHRQHRPIEPEAVFGQSKANKQYYRFRHFDKEKVMMDYAIFATAFNLLKWMWKATNMSKNEKIGVFCAFFLDFIIYRVAFLKKSIPQTEAFSGK